MHKCRVFSFKKLIVYLIRYPSILRAQFAFKMLSQIYGGMIMDPLRFRFPVANILLELLIFLKFECLSP